MGIDEFETLLWPDTFASITPKRLKSTGSKNVSLQETISHCMAVRKIDARSAAKEVLAKLRSGELTVYRLYRRRASA